MSFIKKPSVHHPKLPKNKLGLTRRDYEGALSTLCAGCGHDSVSSAIIEACFNLSIPAHKLAKLSGIGCSSKTPTYFLNKSQTHYYGIKITNGLNEADLHGTLLLVWALSMILNISENENLSWNIIKP